MSHNDPTAEDRDQREIRLGSRIGPRRKQLYNHDKDHQVNVGASVRHGCRNAHSSHDAH